MWGRSVFDNIQKFLQFQLTVNVVALTLTFVSAVTGNEPPLNAVRHNFETCPYINYSYLLLFGRLPGDDVVGELDHGHHGGAGPGHRASLA